MPMKTLLITLIGCYGKQVNESREFFAVLQKVLPSSMTEEHATQLAHRLIKRCKFAPSIAEILEEWKQMRREIYREEAVYHPEQQTQHLRRQTLQQAKDIKTAWHEGASAVSTEVTPDLREFIYTFFPDMSDDTMKRNWLEIMNCKKDREQELIQNSRWRTYMKLNKEGNIELIMRKIA